MSSRIVLPRRFSRHLKSNTNAFQTQAGSKALHMCNNEIQFQLARCSFSNSGFKPDTSISHKPDEEITNKRKPATTSLEATAEYRQNQLKKVTEKFSHDSSDSSHSSSMSSWWSSKPLDIQDYDDVQPMWKDMESRVLKRRLPPKLSEVEEHPTANRVYVGRRNIRKTEEEAWLAAGLYDTVDEKEEDGKEEPFTDKNP